MAATCPYCRRARLRLQPNGTLTAVTFDGGTERRFALYKTWECPACGCTQIETGAEQVAEQQRMEVG